MTGEEMKAIRQKLGLSALEMGRAFGYDGAPPTVRMMIHRFESGGRPLPTSLARLMLMFEKWEVPYAWTDEPPPSPSELDEFKLDGLPTSGEF